MSYSTVKPIKQGYTITASVDFSFRNPATNRMIRVLAGSRWTVTNPGHDQLRSGLICIERENIARLNLGFRFTWDTLVQFFGVNNLPPSFYKESHQ